MAKIKIKVTTPRLPHSGVKLFSTFVTYVRNSSLPHTGVEHPTSSHVNSARNFLYNDDNLRLQLRINDMAAVTLTEQGGASDALTASMARHLIATHIRTQENRQSHAGMMNRDARQLHAAQHCVLANEVQAAPTAHQAAIDAATAETRFQLLMRATAQQRLSYEETHCHLAQTQAAITSSTTTSASRINDTQNALIRNAQTMHAEVAHVVATTSQGFATIQQQAQTSAIGKDLKHASSTDELVQRINRPISNNNTAVPAAQTASQGTLLAQQQVTSTAANLQKIFNERSVLPQPQSVTCRGILSTTAMEQTVAKARIHHGHSYDNDPYVLSAELTRWEHEGMADNVDSLTPWETTQPHLANTIPRQQSPRTSRAPSPSHRTPYSRATSPSQRTRSLASPTLGFSTLPASTHPGSSTSPVHMSPDIVATTGTIAVLSPPPGEFCTTSTIRDWVHLQPRVTNDTAAITLYEQICASDALRIANMGRHLHAIQITTKDDNETHVTVSQHNANADMHANDEARHSMITAVTARLTPDCVAAHLHTAQVMTSVQAHRVGPNVNEAPGAHRPYKFSNNMDGWTKIVTNVLDRFKSEFGAVLVRIPMQKLAWKPAVMDLDAHIANFQIHLHYLTLLQSPLAITCSRIT
jgi:hypothetical protein